MINNQSSVILTQNNTNKHKSKNTFINSGIIAGTTATGALAGAIKYNSDKKTTETKISNYNTDKLELKTKYEKMEPCVEANISEYKSELQTKYKDIESLRPIRSRELDKVLYTLYESFSGPIDVIKRGGNTPKSCIMLEGQDPQVNNILIKTLMKKNDDYNFIEIKHTDNVLDYLEKAEENYQKTHKRTLLHVDGLEQLINSKTSSSSIISDVLVTIEGASEDFHSTIIFSTLDSSKLDQRVIQPYRVKKINVNINKTDCEKIKELTNQREATGKEIVLINKKIKELTNQRDVTGKEITLINKKLTELTKNIPSKSKILIGASIGFIVGLIGIGVKYLVSQNQENK